VQEDGGVGVEAWEDGVSELRHGGLGMRELALEFWVRG
jgi:hypothetical protein